jgi:hypothetical protein
MSWRCLEGFDGLASAAELPLRSWFQVGAGLAYSSTGGRRGSGGLVDTTTGSTTERGWLYTANFNRSTPALAIHNVAAGSGGSYEFGFAFKLSGSGFSGVSSGWFLPLAGLKSGASTSQYCRLLLSGTTWLLQVGFGAWTARVSVAFPGGGGPGTMPVLDQWYFVTWLCDRFDQGTTGTKSQHLIVDGITSNTLSSTLQTANIAGNLTGIEIGCANGLSGDLPSGCSVAYDDVVFASGGGEQWIPTVGTTVAASSFMGPVRIDNVVGQRDNASLTPVFTPSAGSDQFAMVDEQPQDGDTTYISSATIGNRGQGGMPPSSGDYLPHTPTTIWGVKANAVVKNAGAGVAVVRCDLYWNTTLTATANGRGIPYSIPAGGAYEGLHSIVNVNTSADDDRHGANDAGTTKWTVGTLRTANSVVTYVS